MAEVSTMSRSDYEKVWAWNEMVSAPVERTVHSLVEEQAAARPVATAVSAWDGELTYSELDSLASRLALHLSSLGVGAEVVVPLCFEKSRWTVVAMLAVTKAGGAFAAMDASQPLGRLQSIVQQTRATIMLCSSLQASRWSGGDGNVTAHTVDAEWFATSGEGKQSNLVTNPVDPSSALYVVFTSGSTGKPKGVVITHTAFSSAFANQARSLGFHTGSRTFDFASYAFDVSVSNFFMTLASGGCLCVPSDADRQNDLGKAIRNSNANLVHLTPSTARLLDSRTEFNLDTLLFIGEPMGLQDSQGWRPTTRIVNTYGPAECTPISTINTSGSKGVEATHIGRGIGAVTWVVDPEDDTRLSPIGSVGELLIEGPIVGRGYLYDAEKTAAAFIQDPPWLVQGPAGDPGVGGQPSAGGSRGRHGRLYKTGDLVRYNDDGSLVFVGRKDTQVKIHGQRVELGEIEHHVQVCVPGAQQVAVDMFVPGGNGATPMLAAFIVTAKNTNMTNGDLTNGHREKHTAKVITVPIDVGKALAEQLPNYMVPAVFFVIDSIPVNASGKRDRKQLQAIGAGFTAQQLADMRRDSKSDNKRAAPSTEAERALQKIWARVLDLKAASIKADDSFFHLGGDSFAAIKLVALARHKGRHIAVADVFRNPKLADLAALCAEVTDVTGSELIDQGIAPFSLLQRPAADHQRCREEAAVSCQVNVGAIQDAYPCTPLQEGLLALTAKSKSAYVLRNVQHLAPNIDLGRFQAAWAEAVRRIAILRTRIVQDSHEGLLQVVVDEGIEWMHASSIRRYLDSAAPMGLGQRLVRFALVNDAESGRAQFVLTMHHAVYDDHFWHRLHDLVARIYRSSIPLGGDVYDFKLFAKYITSVDTSQAITYWRGALAGYDAEPFPSLPVGAKANGRKAGFGTIERQCEIAPIAQPDVTVATLVRAAWALTAAAATGTKDVVFGATVSGRHAPVDNVDTIAGPTIATIPVRIFIEPGQSVQQFLRGVQEQSTDMIAYEQTGLQHIQRASNDAHRACQFQTLMVIHPQAETDLGEDSIGTWDPTVDVSDFDNYSLTLNYTLSKKAVTTHVAYNKDYLTEDVMRLLLERFESALHQLASAMEGESISDIDVMSQSDYDKVWKWNGMVPAVVERTVHSLVEEKAAARPDAMAVSAWDGELTYGELDSLASRLARHLSSSLGVGTEVVVPLCFERSMWTVVSMLAVLKAGGAFTLMEATQPLARLRSIVEQTRAMVMLCSSLETDRWSGGDGTVTVLTVDAEWFASADVSHVPKVNGTEKPTTTAAASASYVVFTSGSTGTPKGVIVTHSAFSSALVYQSGPLGYHDATRVFDFASYAFDMAVETAFFALASGLCFCVPSDSARKGDLTKALTEMRVDHVKLTPSAARTINRRELCGLKTLLYGGEGARKDDMDGWEKGVQIVATYGPAECTPNTTLEPRNGGESIGKAVGAVTWLVNPEDDSKLTPVGSVGELLIEGPIVGRGYLYDAEKTAATFIYDPPWLVQGPARRPGAGGRQGRHGRLYKTGDLARYNDDGSLVFIGRKDTQVKIRGQRVELGEIEHHIQVCLPEATQVAAEVFIPSGDGANPVLGAFIVMADNANIMNGDLTKGNLANGDAEKHAIKVITLPPSAEEALAERLSSYMVPSIFFAMDNIPVNTSGKTDRKRLREIGASFTVQQLADIRRGEAGSKREPSTEAERALQQIWARVLNLDPASIGADDSFFRLGGDSISAMQVSAMARATIGDISSGDILRKKTISQLISFMPFGVGRTLVASGQTSSHTVPDGTPFPLSPIQKLHVHMNSRPLRLFDQSFFLRLRLRVSLSSVESALQTLVSRHSMLRARFYQDGGSGVWQQQISDDVTGSFHLDHATGQDAATPAEAIRRCRGRIDPMVGPLLAAVLFDGDTASGVEHTGSQDLFISIHHLVVDLVSWRILLQELEELLTSGRASVPPTASFSAWCSIQAQYAALHLTPKASAADTGIELAPLSYWDLDVEAVVESATSTKHFFLDETTTDALFGPCNVAFGTRPVELLVAALTYSFGLAFPNRPTPTVFSEGHGREVWDDAIDIFRTVGWFTTYFPAIGRDVTGASLVDIVRLVKDSWRRLPANGWSYFTSRFADETAAQANSSSFPVEVSLNYEGRYQQLEREDSALEVLPLPEDCRPVSAETTQRYALFDVEANIDRGRLNVSIICPKWPEQSGHQARVATWVQGYQEALVQLAAQLRERPAELTLADLPIGFQSYDDLASFRARVLPRLKLTEANIEDVYQCSAVQEGILLAQAKNPGYYRSGLDVEIEATRGDGHVDRNRVERAWRMVVRRHALLRALLVDRIPGRSGTVHVILRDPVPKITYTKDFGGGAEMIESAIGYAQHELQHHLTVVEVAGRPNLVRLRFDINHAIIDAHSTNVLLDDFRQAYSGGLDPNGPLYRGFIQYTESRSAEADGAYWESYLEGVQPCFLPSLSGGSRVDKSHSEAILSINVPISSAGGIHAFCTKWETTTAAIMQVAWALVLRAFTGSASPCFGILMSGRDVPVEGVHDIFGPLIGFVPSRVALDGHQSVTETLAGVQRDYIDSLPHQTYPLMQIQRALQTGMEGLFNSIVSVKKGVAEEVDIVGDDGHVIRTIGGEEPIEVSLEFLG
jgi:amino acid adenylation domain-containing protein/non-ribosomal peptide synthase protein (TIGR01720 family)